MLPDASTASTSRRSTSSARAAAEKSRRTRARRRMARGSMRAACEDRPDCRCSCFRWENARMTLRPYNPERPGGQPPYDHAPYASTHKRHPKEKLVKLEHTLTEVTGPGFAGGWAG